MHVTDTLVQNYFALARTPQLTEYLYIFTNFFDVSVYSLTLAACIAYLVYLVRGARYSSLFLASLFTGAIMVYVCKIFFNVARPGDAVMSAFGQSFPSYHATISTVFFIMLMYIFDDYLNSFLRITFNSLCIFAICVVAFSRVYLGVHWLSDVVFGILLGSFISYASVILFRKFTASL